MFDAPLASLESKLLRCRELLDELLDCLMDCSLRDDLTGLDYSKVFAAISFTLCSLHYVQLKLSGKDPRKHPITSGLARIKRDMQEIHDILTRESRPRLSRAGAKRVIRSLI